MSYMIVDLETTTKESYKRTANPFDFANRIVATGSKIQGEKIILEYLTESPPVHLFLHRLGKCQLLIGHNIKFDLLYLWQEPVLQQWLLAGGKIWDTQLVEYMLSGQTHTYPSLDQCSLKYGGTIKDDRIKALWKAGACTTEIPKDMLLEYLAHDVKNTELVYLAQLEELKKNPKLFKLVELQMDGLLATTEMEYNGMHIHLNTANANKNYLISELDKMDRSIISYIRKTIPYIQEGHLNLNSNQHISALFFGGKIKYTYKEVVGVFKTGERKGQTKYVNTESYYEPKGITKPHHAWKPVPSINPNTGMPKPWNGVYSVDEGTLTALSKRGVKLAVLLLERRSLAKELNTYYESMIKLVQPDGKIHHSLNHTSTATGRLSSTKPNLQNIPRESASDWDVKQVFTSRYTDGVVIEADFKGAEVFAAAFVSQDEQMILDLESGIDTHKIRASEIWNVPVDDVTDQQKQSAKEASFQLLYGSGAKNIAVTKFNGDEELAKSFIKAYYDRYNTLKQWQNRLVQEVENGRLPSSKKTDKGYPAGTSTIKSCTGRRYTFTEYDAPDWVVEHRGISTCFSPTEIKNYPIQGLATADIVPIMIGKLFRIMIKHRDKALMINTVHDSVLLDCKKEYVTIVANTSKMILQGVKEAVKELGLDWNVPVSVDVKFGSNWGHMRKLEENIDDN